MKVIVLGAGAIGGYYGGQLAGTGHDVTLYARGDNLAAIRQRGLEIRTPEGSSVVQLRATDRIEELGVADFAILGWAWRHPRHKVDLKDFPHVERWYNTLMARPATKRGMEAKLD